VRDQPSNQTPRATRTAIGIPGRIANQISALGTLTQWVPSYLTRIYAIATASASSAMTPITAERIARAMTRNRAIWLLSALVVGSSLMTFTPTPLSAQAAATLAPNPKFVGLNNSGAPCAGCLLYTYVTGTTTPLATYTDSAMSGSNANPIVLDAAGRATIYLVSSTSYKFVLKTAASVTLWTVDPVTPTNAGNIGLGEYFSFGGLAVSPVTAAAYLSGATFDKLHAGTAVWNIDTLNIPAGTYELEVNGLVTAGTLTVALVNLTDGAPDTPLTTVTITSTTGQRTISTGITLASGGAAKNYGIKVKQSTGAGYAWGIKLMRVA
jgi:hypothetical protein